VKDQTVQAGVEQGLHLLADLVGIAEGEHVSKPLLGQIGAVGPRGECAGRFLVGGSDRERAEARLRDLGRITTDRLAMVVEHAEQVPDGRRISEDVAAVRVLRDEPKGLPLTAAADEDRDVSPERARIVEGAFDAVVTPFEARRFLREHRARDLEMLFEPFQQGPSAPQHSPGVGVGLTLVRRFAELHGGRAWIEERAGGGASFQVFIPGSPPDDAAP